MRSGLPPTEGAPRDLSALQLSPYRGAEAPHLARLSDLRLCDGAEMLGFGNFKSASRFCSALDELRDYFRAKRRGQPIVSLADQRPLFIDRWRSLAAEVAAA